MSELASEPGSVVLKPTQTQPKDRVFFVVWVVAVTISSVIADNLGPWAGNTIGGPLADWLIHFVTALFLLEIPRDTFNLILFLGRQSTAGLFAGLASGLVLGLTQWLVLRLRFRYAIAWWAVTVVGFACVGALSSGTGSLTGLFQNPWLSILYLLVVDAPVTGFIVGVLQWLVLRQSVRNAFLWLFIPWLNQIGSTALLAAAVLFALPLSIDSEQWLIGDCILILYEGFFAIISGLLLVWLMSHDARFARFVQPES